MGGRTDRATVVSRRVSVAVALLALAAAGCASSGARMAEPQSLGVGSPAEIASIVTAANDGEIREALLVLQRSTNAQVQDFARNVIADQQKANRQIAAFLAQHAPTIAMTSGAEEMSAQNAPVEAVEAPEMTGTTVAAAPPPAPGAALTGDGVDVRQPGGVPPIATAALTGDGVKVRSGAIVSGTRVTVQGGAPAAVQEIPPVSPVGSSTGALSGASAAPLAALQAESARRFTALSSVSEPAFDGAYIADQIASKEAWLRTLNDTLLPAVQDHALRELLGSLRTQVQTEVDDARRVQESLRY